MNLAFLVTATPASAGPNIYKTCVPFMRSASEHDIRLQWLSLREGYSGQLYERCQRLLDKIPQLEAQDYTHALVLEAPLVEFRCGPDGFKPFMTDTLFVEAVQRPYCAYDSDTFFEALATDGKPHDSRIALGPLKEIKAQAESILSLSREFLAGIAKPGIALQLMSDKEFTSNIGKYAEDFQFLSLLDSIYRHMSYFPVSMFFNNGPFAEPGVVNDP